MKNPLFSCLPLMLMLLLVSACGRSPEAKVNRGINEYNRARYAEARRLLQKALEPLPPHASHAAAWNALGLACWRDGARPEAEAAFLKSLQLEPFQHDANFNLGAVLVLSDRFAEGQSYLENAAVIGTNRTEALEFMGAEHLKRGDAPAAQRVLIRAARRAESPQILTALALAYVPQQGPSVAAGLLEQALQLDPKFSPARYNLAVLQDAWLNTPGPAMENYERYLGMVSPELPQARVAKRRVKALAEVLDLQPVPTPQPVAVATSRPPSPTPVPTLRPTPTPRPTPTRRPSGLPGQRMDTGQHLPTPTPDLNQLSPEEQVKALLDRAGEEVQASRQAEALNLCLQAAATASRHNKPLLEERAIRSAVAMCPDSARARFALGRLYMDREKYDEATEAFRTAAELEPNWAGAHQATANAAMKASAFQTAMEALKQAVRVAPDQPDPLYQLGVFYMDDLGVNQSAIDAFHLFLQRFPDDRRTDNVRLRLDKLTAELPPTPAPGVDDGAMRPPVPSRPVELVPSDAAPSTLMPRPAPRIATNSASNDLVRIQAQSIYGRAVQAQSRDDLDSAADLYQQALELDPSFAPAHYNLGVLHYQRKQLPEAEAAYRAAIRHDPGMADALFNLGVIALERGSRDQAADLFRQALARQPQHPKALHMLGNLHAAQGGKAEARRYYEQLVALAPRGQDLSAVQRWLIENPL